MGDLGAHYRPDPSAKARTILWLAVQARETLADLAASAPHPPVVVAVLYWLNEAVMRRTRLAVVEQRGLTWVELVATMVPAATAMLVALVAALGSWLAALTLLLGLWLIGGGDHDDARD